MPKEWISFAKPRARRKNPDPTRDHDQRARSARWFDQLVKMVKTYPYGGDTRGGTIIYPMGSPPDLRVVLTAGEHGQDLYDGAFYAKPGHFSTTRGRYATITLQGVLVAPGDRTDMVTRLHAWKPTFIHEAQHYQDWKRTGYMSPGSAARRERAGGGARGQAAYHQSPEEWNAYYQHGWATYEGFVDLHRRSAGLQDRFPTISTWDYLIQNLSKWWPWMWLSDIMNDPKRIDLRKKFFRRLRGDFDAMMTTRMLPRRMNSDEEMRALERLASTGDLQAQAHLERMKERSPVPRVTLDDYNAALAKEFRGIKKDLGALSISQNYKGTGSQKHRRQLWIRFPEKSIDVFLDSGFIGIGGVLSHGTGRVVYSGKTPRQVYEESREIIRAWLAWVPRENPDEDLERSRADWGTETSFASASLRKVLGVVGTIQVPLSLRQVAEESALSETTTRKALAALISKKWVDRLPGGKYMVRDQGAEAARVAPEIAAEEEVEGMDFDAMNLREAKKQGIRYYHPMTVGPQRQKARTIVEPHPAGRESVPCRICSIPHSLRDHRGHALRYKHAPRYLESMVGFRFNPDEDLRRLERAAQGGDVDALEKLTNEAARRGDRALAERCHRIASKMVDAILLRTGEWSFRPSTRDGMRLHKIASRASFVEDGREIPEHFRQNPAPEKRGNCFRDAFQFQKAHPPMSGKVPLLVHGSVPYSRAIGGRIPHAWVEINSRLVYEPQTRQLFASPVPPGGRAIVKYAPEQAQAHLRETKHYGPWDPRMDALAMASGVYA